jgi:hypothetical protein
LSVFDRAQASQIIREHIPLIQANMRTMVPFTINGATYGPEQLLPLFVIDPASIDVHMAEVAAWIGFWGTLVASAKREHDRFDAQYRHKRDAFVVSNAGMAVTEVVETDAGKTKTKTTKKSKTAAEAEWRTDAEYVKLYERKSDLEYAWNCAQMVYEALNKKANMLTALGKLYDNERIAPTGAAIPRV